MAKKISGSVGKGGKSAVIDTAGELVVTDSVSMSSGNPPPSAVLTISAPASPSPQTAGVAFPIGDGFEFVYDPDELGPVESLDFLIDVLPETVSGTAEVQVTLSILQGDAFVAFPTSSTPSIDGTEIGWSQLRQFGLRAEDFAPADGGVGRPDFGRPFEFGYAFIAEYADVPLAVQLQLDNMEATINTVPEPTAFVLVALLGSTLLWQRGSRRRLRRDL